MKTTAFNKEVLFATDAIVQIDASDIAILKQKAKQNPRKRIRICAHKDTKDNIHEMLIVHEKSCYVRPHKHINKTETFHIIEGEADILLFDEKGHIDQTIPMGSYNSGRKFFYRLPPFRYHTLVIHSDVLVFHEITNGPFRPEETTWAPWSPEEIDQNLVSLYMEKLFIEINSYGKRHS
jgi:cupin fold WbuC family metalloprotein